MGTHPWGVNATGSAILRLARPVPRFNGHPPLGVNATVGRVCSKEAGGCAFQWAPTLGVNATPAKYTHNACIHPVSMGTHPWG